MDIATILPTQKTLLAAGARSPGAAAIHAFEKKQRYWARVKEDSPEEFLPLAVELFGGWHQESAEAISRMAHLAAHATASEVGVTSSRLWQRLSVLIYNPKWPVDQPVKIFHVYSPIEQDMALEVAKKGQKESQKGQKDPKRPKRGLN